MPIKVSIETTGTLLDDLSNLKDFAEKAEDLCQMAAEHVRAKLIKNLRDRSKMVALTEELQAKYPEFNNGLDYFIDRYAEAIVVRVTPGGAELFVDIDRLRESGIRESILVDLEYGNPDIPMVSHWRDTTFDTIIKDLGEKFVDALPI